MHWGEIGSFLESMKPPARRITREQRAEGQVKGVRQIPNKPPTPTPRFRDNPSATLSWAEALSPSYVADSNVFAGYDIDSTRNGETHCNEVKSSAAAENDLFPTANEHEVLTKLGGRAWLHRVRIDGDGSGKLVRRLQDPMSKIPEVAMRPLAWRVNLESVDMN